MPSDVTLKGSFVDLRPLFVEDAEITFGWRSAARARLLNQGAQSLEQQIAWINSRPSNEYNFIIALKSGRPVGMLSLVAVDLFHRRAEPGRFLIGDEEAVRGLPAAVEAMKLLYDFAFWTLGLIRVFGTVADDNKRMAKWQRYLGMREEGRLRRHYFINDHFQDAIIFGLLVDEYREQTMPRMNALISLAGPGEGQNVSGGTIDDEG